MKSISKNKVKKLKKKLSDIILKNRMLVLQSKVTENTKLYQVCKILKRRGHQIARTEQ